MFFLYVRADRVRVSRKTLRPWRAMFFLHVMTDRVWVSRKAQRLIFGGSSPVHFPLGACAGCRSSVAPAHMIRRAHAATRKGADRRV